MYYVPDLHINLLSIYQLISRGRKVEFLHEKVFIKDAKDDYKVTTKDVIDKDSCLFKFEGFTNDLQSKEWFTMIAFVDEKSKLWHLCMESKL